MTGCGKKKPADEVLMWLVGSEAQAKTVSELAEKFRLETGINVRCEAVAWGEAHSKYLTSIAGGLPPDIGTMGLTWASEFGSLGTMIDLAQEFPDDVKGIKNNIFPSIWRSVEYKNRVYSIPFDMTISLMYYRSDIIKTPPATWEEMTGLLKNLNRENKGMLFDWGSMEWVGFSPYLWQAGGDYYNETYDSSTANSREAVRAMKYFTDLYKVYKVPKTKIPLEQGMRTGDFPICISGNWKIIGLTVGAPEILDKWMIAALPKGPAKKGTAFIGGRTLGIFKLSKNKEKAWRFIKYLSKPESQAHLYNASIETQDAYLPPNTDSWALLDMKPEFKGVLIRQALEAKGPPPVLGWDSASRYVNEAIQRVILQDADIAQEMKTLKGLLDLELKRNSN